MSKFLRKSSLGACWPSNAVRSFAQQCSPLARSLESRLRANLSFLCTRLRPGDIRRGLAGVAARFLEEFCPAGLFCSNQQIPRLCRSLAGESRTGRSRRRDVNFLKDGKRGSAVSTPEKGGKRHEVEYVFLNSFSNDRVRILLAENAGRTC